MDSLGAGFVLASFMWASASFADSGEPQSADAGVGCGKEGMTRPERLPQPTDSSGGSHPPSLGAKGVCYVKCRLTAQGKAEECRILKSEVGPKTDQAVIEWILQQTYKPVTCAGKPVGVESYVWPFRFK